MEEAVMDFILAASILLLLVFGIGGSLAVLGEWLWSAWKKRR